MPPGQKIENTASKAKVPVPARSRHSLLFARVIVLHNTRREHIPEACGLRWKACSSASMAPYTVSTFSLLCCTARNSTERASSSAASSLLSAPASTAVQYSAECCERGSLAPHLLRAEWASTCRSHEALHGQLFVGGGNAATAAPSPRVPARMCNTSMQSVAITASGTCAPSLPWCAAATWLCPFGGQYAQHDQRAYEIRMVPMTAPSSARARFLAHGGL